jgi:hypothetical protein
MSELVTAVRLYGHATAGTHSGADSTVVLLRGFGVARKSD